MKKIIITSLILILTLIISSCNKANNPDISQSDIESGITSSDSYSDDINSSTESDTNSDIETRTDSDTEDSSSSVSDNESSNSTGSPFPTSLIPTQNPTLSPTLSPTIKPTISPTTSPQKIFNLKQSDFILNLAAWKTPYLREDKGFEFEVEITSLGTSYQDSIVRKSIRNLNLGTYEPMRCPGSVYEWGYSFTHLDGAIDGAGRVIEAGYPTPPKTRQEALEVIEAFLYRQYLTTSGASPNSDAIIFWMKVDDSTPPNDGKTQLQIMIGEENQNNPGHMGPVYFSNWKSFDYYFIGKDGRVNSDNNTYIAVPSGFEGQIIIPFTSFESHPAYHDPNGKFDPDKLFMVSFDLHASTAGSKYYFDNIGVVNDLQSLINTKDVVKYSDIGQNFNNITSDQLANFVFPLGPSAVKQIVSSVNGKALMLQSATGSQIHEGVKLSFTGSSGLVKRPWISKNGHYMWHHYAGEFGFDVLSSEIGENINSYQMHIAFNRGAAKQYNVPWAIDFSAWHGPSITDYSTGKIWGQYSGPDHGHSMNLLERTYFMSYMSGAPYIIAEAGGAISFYDRLDVNGNYVLSPYGEVGKKVYDFSQKYPDVGMTYTPIGLVLDYYHGVYPGFGQKIAFNHFPYNAGDHMTWNLLNMFFPGGWEVMGKQEVGTMVNGPYGDTCDVLLQNASQTVLNSYPVLILSGDIKLSQTEIGRYKNYVNQGGTLVLNSAYLDYFPEYKQSFTNRSRYEMQVGKGKVIAYSGNYSVSQLDAIIREQLDRLIPIKISTDIQHILSVKNGSLFLTLINNDGVKKDYKTPPVFDFSKTKTFDVTYTGNLKLLGIKDIKNNKTIGVNNKISVTLNPGTISILEYKFD